LRNRKHRVTDTRHGGGSLQPGRPPTNTSFNTPYTQRDRSNTVRVVQIIHRNLSLNLGLLECPKRCRTQELNAPNVSSSYINVSHGTGGGIFTNFRHSVPSAIAVIEFLKSFNIWEDMDTSLVVLFYI